MPHTPDCIFCKIVAKEIPSHVLIENEKAIAILDAFPMAKGHVLVLPKAHVQYFHQINESSLSATTELLQKLTKALYEITGQDYNILNNNGHVAGQSVFHLHWHLLPRLEGDNVLRFNHGEKQTSDYYDEWGQKITATIKSNGY